MTENDFLYERGNTCWHSSAEDGGPDVGISLGLGGAMLYVGEVPGVTSTTGWSMAVYPLQGDRIDIAPSVNAEEGRALLERLALLLRAQS